MTLSCTAVGLKYNLKSFLKMNVNVVKGHCGAFSGVVAEDIVSHWLRLVKCEDMMLVVYEYLWGFGLLVG